MAGRTIYTNQPTWSAMTSSDKKVPTSAGFGIVAGRSNSGTEESVRTGGEQGEERGIYAGSSHIERKSRADAKTIDRIAGAGDAHLPTQASFSSDPSAQSFNDLEHTIHTDILDNPAIQYQQEPGPESLSNQTTYISANEAMIGQETVSHPERLRQSIIICHQATYDIIAQLGTHGCPDVTRLLDMSTASTWPVSSGGFGDVYKAKLYDSTEVAVKTSRVFIDSAEGKKSLKRAAQELYAWSKCSHPNVLRLTGLAVFRDQIGMVSPWMPNGSLPTYLARHHEADRIDISIQIAEGLAYLHTNGIVHGDLKGMNVLVANDGTAVLTDFGNAVLSNQSLLFTSTTSKASISLRWTAPELLHSDEPSAHSKEADIYALGMTILETVTGEVPYANKSEQAVMFAVWQQNLPNRPEQLSTEHEHGDTLWLLLTSCWDNDPKQRPHATKVVEMMRSPCIHSSNRIVHQGVE